MARERSYYERLAAIDVSQFIEKKGQFSYLSWVWAVDQLRRQYPTATWETKKFLNNGVLMPYMDTPGGAYVEVDVTVEGVTLTEIFPVLDFKNKSVINPSSFDVNKAQKRCLAKAIANHGLGLYIYAGEDLPMQIVDYITDQQIDSIQKRVKEFAALRGRIPEDVYKALQITNLESITEEQADKYSDVLAGWIKAAKDEAAAKNAKDLQPAVGE